MSKVLQIKKFKDIIAEGNIFPNPPRCGSINDKCSLRTMAGAISCERPSAWHIYIKSIFDQGEVGRVVL